MYTHIQIYINIHIHIYIYGERQTERGRDRVTERNQAKPVQSTGSDHASKQMTETVENHAQGNV